MPGIDCDLVITVWYLYEQVSGEVLEITAVVMAKGACSIPKRLKKKRRGLKWKRP